MNKEKIQKALKEYNESNNRYIKYKNKKLLAIILTISIIIILIKITINTINIPNIFGYPTSNVRYYNVLLNNREIDVSYITRNRIQIIPYLINFDSYYSGILLSKNNTDVNQTMDEEKYLIDIESYSCYYLEKYQTKCEKYNQYMKKNNDTKYTNLKITRTSNPYEIIYNDTFKEDITNYITKKGVYVIEITAKHGNTITIVNFNINHKI